MLKSVDLVTQEPTPQVSQYVVYPWLYPGRLTLMVGPSNVGKTTLTLELIAQGLQGGHLWDRYPCRKIERVLYFHAEHTLATLQEMAAVRGDIAPNTVRVVHDFGDLTSRLLQDGKPHLALVKEMRACVADWQPQLIVFEPISAFVGGSENDNAEVRGKPRTGPDGKPLDPKEQGEARGAAAFEDAAECVVYLRRAPAKGAQHVRLETSKIKGFPVSPVTLAFDEDTLTYRHVPQSLAERDLTALYNWGRDHPGATVRETIEHFRDVWKGVRDAKIVLMLQRAARVGLIREEARLARAA